MKNLIIYPSIVFILFGFNYASNWRNSIYMQQQMGVKEIENTVNTFDRFKKQILGHFSNKEEVDQSNTKEPLQEFIIVQIMKDKTSEFWVYLEFFSPLMVDAPIDQRIERYKRISRDTFLMEVYYLKDPARFVNAWAKESFPDLNINQDLVKDSYCDLFLTWEGRNTFKTVPPMKLACEMLTSTLDIKYVDIQFVLDLQGYLMWFSFYDFNKKHIKTTQNRGINFKRLKRTKESFLRLI